MKSTVVNNQDLGKLLDDYMKPQEADDEVVNFLNQNLQSNPKFKLDQAKATLKMKVRYEHIELFRKHGNSKAVTRTVLG